MDQPGELLASARALITRGWTQHADARDRHGNPAPAWSDQAASWSLLGALIASLEKAAVARGEPLEA